MKSWDSLLEDTGVVKSTFRFKNNFTGRCEMPMKRLQARFGSGKPHTTTCLKAKWYHWTLPLFLQHSLKPTPSSGDSALTCCACLNSKYLEVQAIKWRQDSHPPWQTKSVWIHLFKLIWTDLHYPKPLFVYKTPLPSKNRKKKLSQNPEHTTINAQIYLSHSCFLQLQGEQSVGITHI